jgi:hypothetical protein
MRAAPVLAAAAVALALVGLYALLGGASYEPAKVADPCVQRPWRDPEGTAEGIEQVVLSALDGAACSLGASREELVLALRSTDALDDFASEHGLDEDEVEDAVRDGIVRSVDEAEDADVIGGTTATVLRGAAERLPFGLVLDLVRGLSGLIPG